LLRNIISGAFPLKECKIHGDIFEHFSEKGKESLKKLKLSA
jgi:hypothetical protein